MILNDLQGKELAAAIKESEKLAEELNSQAVKVKWAQNKLKTELEGHKVLISSYKPTFFSRTVVTSICFTFLIDTSRVTHLSHIAVL